MIKKDKDGYKVVSKKGKNLGSGYKTRAAAAKRHHGSRQLRMRGCLTAPAGLLLR